MCANSRTVPGVGRREKSVPKRRSKLWELEPRFHCSVVGTCLTLDELRRLARKLKIRGSDGISDYELHTTFVGIAGHSTPSGRLLHKRLDRKFAAEIRRYSRAATAAELDRFWRDSLKSGEVAGAYWALITHPQVSDELLFRSFGKVHMLSHLSGASVRIDMQQLQKLRRKLPVLENELAAERRAQLRRLNEKERVIDELRREIRDRQQLEKALNDANRRIQQLERDSQTIRLREQMEAYAAKLVAERARAERAEANVSQWKQTALEHGDNYCQMEQRLHQLQDEHRAMETALAEFLSPECGNCENSDACSRRQDLSERCILYVGGRAGQCHHFRALVEKRNGRFLHHDGGKEESRLRLGSILPQADVVICPLDCVSHDAMHKVRRHCQQHAKPLVFIPRASLSAFTRCLNEVPA